MHTCQCEAQPLHLHSVCAAVQNANKMEPTSFRCCSEIHTLQSSKICAIRRLTDAVRTWLHARYFRCACKSSGIYLVPKDQSWQPMLLKAALQRGFLQSMSTKSKASVTACAGNSLCMKLHADVRCIYNILKGTFPRSGATCAWHQAQLSMDQPEKHQTKSPWR